MINWHILSASANNGCMRVCVRPRMKKGNIHSNNENNQNKWCADCGCVESCLGMRVHGSASEWHGSHGYSGGSVAHDMRMRTHVRACLCGIVGTYLCCHGLRCGSSSRRPAHGRLDSRSFSVSPCRRLRRILHKLEGIARTLFGTLPACTERLEAGGAHGMHARRVCTGAKGGCTCQRKFGERVAAIFGNGLLNAFQNCKTNFSAENIRWNPQSVVK